MNLLRGIIIAHLLCYNVQLRAKEPKWGHALLGGQNKLESAWGGGTTMEEEIPPKDDTVEGETSQTFEETTALEGEDGHPNLRSTFSFFQGKGREEVEPNAQQRHEGSAQRGDVPSDHQGELNHADTPSQIATEKNINGGENLPINGGGKLPIGGGEKLPIGGGEKLPIGGGIADYEYNNDEEFFKSFHSDNANKQIEIKSPCFNLKNENECTESRNCFYDHSYKACFQNCKSLGERDCYRYTECKLTINGCENEGFLNINVFGSDIGSDVRACELFNSEGSCYMMEEQYKNFGSKEKTNFNCVWMSYKHEYRKHKEGGAAKRHKKEPHEQRGGELGGVIDVHRANGQSEEGGHPNYHVLRSDGPRSIARDEKFLSLLELKSNEKKKKNPKNGNNGKETKKENAKKGKAHGDDEDDNDDEDDDDSGEGLQADEDPDFNDVNDEEGAKKEEDLEGEGADEDEDFDDELEKKRGKGKGKEGSSADGEGSDMKRSEGKEPSDEAPSGESTPKGDELLVPPEKLVALPTEVVTESIIEDASVADKDGQPGERGQDGQPGQPGQPSQPGQLTMDGHADAENDELPGGHPAGKGNLGSPPHERDILKHNFHSSGHGDQYDEWISVETSICVNLNERPNPSVLLEGALIAEKEAELRSIKKKYKVTDNEICVKPSNEPNISFSPNKNFYVLGEKIEFKCQNGYKIVGTTTVGVCVGRNKIVPNISCESLNDFDGVQKENTQKINSMISSGGNSALSGFLAVVLFVVGAFLFR
uniref:Rhoptry neck protein-1 n=1 Tax=Plasmodium vivax TaxID=5855 RepID=G8GVE7_PLAVI|nr:rhoptry neck protein-1 [Plasmodium vivax]